MEVLAVARSGLRYLAVGVACTIADFGLFNFLVFVSKSTEPLPLFLYNCFSVAFAAFLGFVLHRHWTFSTREVESSLTGRYFVVTVLGLAFSSLSVFLLAKLGLGGFWLFNGGKVIAALLVFAWKYWAYKYWVFAVDPSLHFCGEGKAGLVSIIIPAFNEEERLGARLAALVETLPAFFPTELIVVDDGSTDDTFAIAEYFRGQYPFVRVLSLAENYGKGAAVRFGMEKARGEYLVFVDADGTFTPGHIQKVVTALEAGGELVIGKRSGPERLEGESTARRFLGAVFNAFVQLFFLPGVGDSQCGLKGFKRETAAALFAKQKLDGFAFDVELLALAKAQGIVPVELPLLARAEAGSKVNFFGVAKMLWELMELKLNLAFNRYQLPSKGLQGELAPASLLFIAAFLVRLPFLWEVPRYIDELGEVKLAYDIYRGVARPLHNAAWDIGSLHNYLLAGIFKFFGPSIYWPRLYVAFTSALTVVLLYFVGKRLFGRTVGLVAALLLMCSGMHIFVTHMAWANSTTPFFFTLALYLTLWAQERKTVGSNFLMGLAWALALQTHASVVVSIAAVALYFIRRGTSLRKLWPAAVGLFLGYGNMIYFNLTSGFGSITWLERKAYTLEQNPGLKAFFQNAGRMLVQFLRVISSSYTELQNPWLYLTRPHFLLGMIALVVGIYNAKNARTLLLWILGAGFLVIPWLNRRFSFFLPTRYILPQVLVGILFVAVGLVRGGRLLAKRGIALQYLWGLGVVIISLQLLPHYRYCRSLQGTNQANTTALAIVKEVQKQAGTEGMVFLDPTLFIENNPLPVLFSLKGQPYLELTEARVSTEGAASGLYLLSGESYNSWQGEPLEVVEKFASQVVGGGERLIYLVKSGKSGGVPVSRGGSD